MNNMELPALPAITITAEMVEPQGDNLVQRIQAHLWHEQDKRAFVEATGYSPMAY